MVEIEVKIKISNLKVFISMLLKNGALFEGKNFQKTIRMDTPDMSLQSRGIFLRVRSGLGDTVTLKVKKDKDKDFKIRDEYETRVKDVDILSKIFSILGFSKHYIMEKYRANFSYKGSQLSLDELPFGIYAEIEGTKEKINSTLNDFGLGKAERITVTYWHLFDDYKKEHHLSDENIVFPKNYKSKIMALKKVRKKE